MNTSQAGFLSEILAGGKISKGILVYFRERLKNRLHQFILREFTSKQKEGLTQADVARMLCRRPEQIHRWLGSPSNLTTDTLSDLLLAISKAEVEFAADKIAERPFRNYRFPEWIDPKHLPVSKKVDVRASIKPLIVESGTTAPRPKVASGSMQIQLWSEAV
jgi:hypothetical protein